MRWLMKHWPVHLQSGKPKQLLSAYSWLSVYTSDQELMQLGCLVLEHVTKLLNEKAVAYDERTNVASLFQRDRSLFQSWHRSVQQGVDRCDALAVEIADAIKLAGKSSAALLHAGILYATAEGKTPVPRYAIAS